VTLWLTSRVLVLALSTGHKVGLAVVGFVFIAFALGSSLLVPRFRPQYPGRALPAFIVVALVFFLGMLTAVEVFGAEPKEKKESQGAGETSNEGTSTTVATSTTATTATTQATMTKATTTTPSAKPQTVSATEAEFKIALASSALKAGKVTFQIKNDGAIPHDLAIVGGPKSKLIPPHGTGTLTATLKPGPVELYCSVPGHKAAGMDLKVTAAS
jgi:nitrite reductase (NO-forming)